MPRSLLIRNGRSVLALLAASALSVSVRAGDAVQSFQTEALPILKQYCYDCHGDGAKKGEIAFDELKAEDETGNHELWAKVLKNVRAGLMPPLKKPQPTSAERLQLEKWIKFANFKIDSENLDPGRVTVRRLNRVEYRNTIRDLMGVDFETDKEFPPDDAGYGFDNIGDVLTLPPMLLEKYLGAARSVVTKAVPSVSGVPAEIVIPGKSFADDRPATNRTVRGGTSPNTLVFSYYEAATSTNTFEAKHGGKYQVHLDFTANERFVDNQFDYNRCRLILRADGHELHRHDYTREGGRSFHYEFDQDWIAGPHELVLEVQPLTPDEKQVRSLTLRIESVTVRGPMAPQHWVKPKNYERFFTKSPPESAAERRDYAREILKPFVERAYRRDIDSQTLDRLVRLAENTYSKSGKTFEAGISQAMVAVLASPRFLFREEAPATRTPGQNYPLVDEFSLASRLSYFLWSSMPDDELLRAARAGELRATLSSQIKRMLDDKKSEAFVRNFVGQWLQTRDVDSVSIDARQVLFRENAPDPEAEKARARFRELRNKAEEQWTAEEKKEMDALRLVFQRRFGRPPRAELNTDLRRAMRQETEKTFDYILREDRPLTEILDSDYTFLNERLATHYGLTNLNVLGDEMRLVKLPPESPRGGVITHGSVLAVTSNPTRTSPVKRGLFVLDNLLGTPPPPPPPDIPPLEDAAKAMKERRLSLRETLALHREAPLCSSCHNRMDPLGLALENFNALGMWRDQEQGQPIDATGKLLTGETFSNIKELKKILASEHASHFYRTITEKMLIYALGRGLEYYDVQTVDDIVKRLEKSEGRPSELLAGIINSTPFQKTRVIEQENNLNSAAKLRADAKN